MIAKLASRRAIAIPGTDQQKPLALLSSRELLAVVRALLGIETEPPTLLERAKRRLSGFVAALATFLDAPQVAVGEALAMRDTLRDAVDQLEVAYALPP